MFTKEFSSGEMVIGQKEHAYKRVLDDFQNAEFIGILTYNISPHNSALLDCLATACKKGTEAVVITNIPQRFDEYFGRRYAEAAYKRINSYLVQLNPQHFGPGMSTYFMFSNHSKIVMTNNIVYWGSSNYSDESKDNLECGTISTDKALIEYLRKEIFPQIQDLSVPYYEHNFLSAIYNLRAAMSLCRLTREAIFEAAYTPWEDYDTGFQTKWVYNAYETGITKKMLESFVDQFKQYETALGIVDAIVEACIEDDDHGAIPADIERMGVIVEKYQVAYDAMVHDIKLLFDGMEEMAKYDVETETLDRLNDEYGMEAYDENLEYSVGKALGETHEEYETLIKKAKPVIIDTMKRLEEMETSFREMADTLQEMLVVNKKIDNTKHAGE